jgi:hypothetical protein
MTMNQGNGLGFLAPSPNRNSKNPGNLRNLRSKSLSSIPSVSTLLKILHFCQGDYIRENIRRS